MSKTRPVGITVLCVLIVISLGLIPIWFAYWFLTNQELARLTGMNLYAFFGNLVIALGIIVSALFTWKGSNRAKKVLVSLVWVHVAGVVFNNINLLINPSLLGLESLDDRQMAKLFINAGRAIFWLVLLHWYFNTEKAKAFFTRGSEFHA